MSVRAGLLAAALIACTAVATAADIGRPVAPAPPLGLPAVPVPADNPPTPAKIDLGRKLFMDRRLSPNNTLSCAMCHVPEQGFTSNELGGAVGIEGRTVRRNAPTIYNVAYLERLFHDGREGSLENQAWGPLLAHNEMGNPSIGYVIDKIRSLPDYGGLFEAAFGGRGPGLETIGAAIASYERAVVSGNSRFDRWYYGKQSDALNEEARRRFELFIGKGRCAACHTVDSRHALFTDQRYHNTGIGWRRSMGGPRTHKVMLAPGVYAEVDEAVIASISAPAPNDVGRYEVTLDPADRWAYRTPSLRNIALTAPYMHDGSLATLADVVEFYDQGGISNPVKDELLQPLGLSAKKKRALVAFLHALTGDNVEAAVRDARTASPSLPDGGPAPPPRQGRAAAGGVPLSEARHRFSASQLSRNSAGRCHLVRAQLRPRARDQLERGMLSERLSGPARLDLESDRHRVAQHIEHRRAPLRELAQLAQGLFGRVAGDAQRDPEGIASRARAPG